MNIIVIAGLIVAGLIHIVPITGILGADRLSALYDVRIEDSSLVMLMQHRAVLFGLLGALLIAAAFLPSLRPAAVIGGVLSIVSFLVLAAMMNDRSAAITRIVYADWIALAALLPVIVVLVQQRGAY